MVDLDDDAITLTADFGPAGNFLSLNSTTSIECRDISSKTSFNAGMYLVKIMLNDKKDTATYLFSIFVIDLTPESIAPGKNETTTIAEKKPAQ
jgi:hypothetical protein